MPQNLTIRKALSSDIPALLRIKPGEGAEYFERCLSEQESGRRELFVLEAGEVGLVAYGILNYAPRYFLYERLGISEIQDLNVVPERRRRGYGRALIEYCEGAVRARGGDQIGISVGLHKGFGPAQRLYVSMGYVPDGYGVTYDREAVAPGENRPVDDDLCLMMVKDLG